MNRHHSISIAAALLIVLVICFVPGCSGDDCQTCPEDTGGTSLSATVLAPQPMPTYYGCMYAAGPQDLFVTAADGYVIRRQGTTWKTYKTGVVAYLRGIWGSSAADVFAVGGNGTVVHFDGSSWRTMNTGIFSSLEAIHGTAANDVWAIGYDRTVMHYDGTAWSPVTIRSRLFG